MALYFVGMKGV